MVKRNFQSKRPQTSTQTIRSQIEKSNATMRKEQLKLRTEGNGSVAPLTSDDSDIENESINKEPTSAGGDAFDNLLSSKPDDSSSTKKTNGVTKAPSPVPDDSDTEKNDTETDAENEADTTELNKTTDKKAATDENDDGEDDDDGDGAEKEKEEQFEVEAIVGTRSRCKQTQYYIKWKNYPDAQNTWEFESDVNCPELIAEYLEKNPKKEKKVRISLPASREAPKRSAAENKSLAESEQESDDDDVSVTAKSLKNKAKVAKSSNAKGRGRPKKDATKSTPAQKEFEVAKIVDEKMDGGKKYFRIRWKGYGAKDDTWELQKSLNCPDKIKEYEDGQEKDDAEYEVEKIMGEMIEKGKRLFYVKWKNWPESDNSWETAESVDCPDLIEKFRDSCRSVAKATKRSATKAPIQTPKKAKKAAKDEDRDPLAEEEESEEEELQWEVKQILDVRSRRGKKEYFIRWKNCDASQDSWEPEDGINCPDLLAAFAKKKTK